MGACWKLAYVGWSQQVNKPHLVVVFVMLSIAALSFPARAAPEGGEITRGKGRIEQSGNRTDIHQNTNFMATRWRGFNLSAGEIAEAHQPNARSRLLIRVDNGAPTRIAGQYISNGITIIENRAGVQFSQGAVVNVGGLLATSSRLDEDTALGRQWRLSGTGGDVVNHGQIIAGPGGVVLAAVRVENAGSITAKGGDVSLGAGSAFTVDFSGGGFVGFEVSKAAGAELINTGEVKAEGGIVRMTAQEARDVRANVVSVGGTVKATKIRRRGGVVYLYGGEEGVAQVSGKVEADEKIEATSDKYVVVKSGARMTAPEILVGGDFQGKGDVATAQRTLIESDALLDAGRGGRVIVWSDEITWFYGELKAKNGFAEVSGKQLLAHVNFDGIQIGHGRLLLDPYNISIILAGGHDSHLSDGEIGLYDGCSTTCTSSNNFYISGSRINSFSGGTLVLRATHNITVAQAINNPGLNLTLEAGLFIQIAANINLGGGVLTLRGGQASGGQRLDSIRGLNGTWTLTAARIELTQSVFQPNFEPNFQYNTPLLGPGDLNLVTSDLILNSTAEELTEADVSSRVVFNTDEYTQYIYNWMVVSGRSLTIRARRNIELRRITTDLGVRTLVLEAGYGTGGSDVGSITFRTGTSQTQTIRAGSITLTADQGVLVPGTHRALTFSSRGDLNINTNISNTNGALNLLAGIGAGAGAINFSRSSGTLINAKNITLVADRDPRKSDRSILLFAINDLHLGASLDAGSLNLEISAGQYIYFGNTVERRSLPVVKLKGGSVDLTAQYAYTSDTPNKDVTITASSVVRIKTSIHIGSGNLRIKPAPSSTLKINFSKDKAISINGNDISLSGAGQPDVSNQNISIQANGNLIIKTDINAGTGDIVLEAAHLVSASKSIRFLKPSNTDDQIVISGRDISLTATAMPEESTINLTIRASRDLNIDTSINIGSGSLNLSEGLNAIVFSGSPTFIANDIELTQASVFGSAGPNHTSNLTLNIRSSSGSQIIHAWMVIRDKDFTISSAGTISVNRSIFVGRGSIVLSAGAGSGNPSPIRFAPGGVIEISARDITLTDNRAYAGRQIARTIRISASGDLNINVISIRANQNITLEAGIGDDDPATQDEIENTGAINFSQTHLVTLESRAIILSADTAPAHAAHSLSLLAGRDLEIGTDLNVGTRTLTLFAGSASKAIVFSNSPVLTGGRIHMTQAAAFPQAAPQVTLAASIRRIFIRNVEAEQTVYSWMIANGVGLSVLSGGDISINNDIDLGTGSLFLEAGWGDTSGAINISGTEAVQLSAADINLIADGTPSAGNALTITALRDLTVAADLNVGTHTLLLSEGHNAIIFTGRPELIGGEISLVQEPAFPQSAPPVTLTASIRRVFISDSASGQGVYSWMGANGIDLSVSSTRNITVVKDMDIGTGDLILEAGRGQESGAINFSEINAIQLFGGNIELIADRSPTSSFQNIGIYARGDLTIETDIYTGNQNSLILEAGYLSESGGALNFSTLKNIVIRAGEVTLSAKASPTVSNQNLIITGRRGVFVYTDINTGTGNLNLSAPFRNESGLRFSVDKHITLTGRDILLISLSAPTAGNALTVMASRNLTIGSDLNTGTHALFLSEGDGAISFIGTPTLTGGEITLTQAAVFPQAAPATLTASIRRVFIGNTASRQEVYSWMIANGVNLSVLSGGDISVNGDIDLGTGSLILEAGRGATSGAINFSGTEAIQLIGADIELIADSAPTAGNALTIMASGDLIIATDLNAGTNALLLSEGTDAIIFTGTRALTGGEISLAQETAFPGQAPATLTASIKRVFISNAASGQTVYSWMITNGVGLSVLSGGDISVNDDIDLGTGSLILEAGLGDTSGAINFSAINAIQLSGTDIELTADKAPTVGNALTIIASGDLTIASDLNAGIRALLLSEGNDAISFTGTPTLTGGEITLAQETAFPEEAVSATLTASIRRIFISNGASGQTVYSWMITNGISLSVLSGGDISVNDDIDLGTGSLILEAGRGDTSGAINFSGTEAIQLSGADIELIADSAPTAGNALTIMASGDLIIASDLNAGTYALLLSEGNDAISFTGTPILTGGEITLTQETAFPGQAPATLTASIRRVFISNGASWQGVYSWMITDGISLSVLSGGDIAINDGIDLGTGSLVLEAGLGDTSGAINFSGIDPIQLSGADIELIADKAPNVGNALTIIASGDLIIASDLNTGTHALFLSEGNDAIIFTGTPTLTGGEISLTQETAFPLEAPATLTASIKRVFISNGASGQTVYSWMIVNGISLSVLSGGDITVNDDIDLGTGSLILEAGRGQGSGAINFSGTEAIQLSGADIELIADKAPTVGNALTIMASGDLIIASDLNAGTHALFLSEGNDAISFTGTPILTGGEITLTQETAFPQAAPATLTASIRRVFISNGASGQAVYSWMIANGVGLSVLSGGDIAVNDDIDLGTGSLVLEAGRGATSGAINFSGTEAIQLSGADIELIADSAPSAGNALTVMASGDLIIASDLNAGTHTLLLSEGNDAISFTGTPILTGGEISLTQETAFPLEAPATLTASIKRVFISNAASWQGVYSWMIVNGIGLSVLSGGDIAINDDIDLGTGSLILEAGRGDTSGAINFSGIDPIQLSGADIELIADKAPTVGNALTIMASGDLIIASDLNAGTHALFLSEGDDAIIFTGTPALTGGEITLAQAAAFPQEAPATLTASIRRIFISNGASGQTVYSWMIANGISLSVLSGGDITVNDDIDLGTGSLILEAGRGQGSGAINFSGTEAIQLSGADIELIADSAPTAGNALTIMASGDLTIASDLNAGTHTLFLSEGSDAISFTGTPALTGGEITLTQETAFPQAAPATLTASIRRVFISNGASGQTVYSWMIANGISLSVLSGGDIAVNDDIDLGTGSLILEAGRGATSGAINFSGTEAIQLSGADIELIADKAPTVGNALTIMASGDLIIASDLNTGTHTLLLSEGTDAIIFTGTPTLTGGEISLAQESAFPEEAVSATLTASIRRVFISNGASGQVVYSWMIANGIGLSVLSGGDISVNDDIDLGAGSLILEAGRGDTSGAINFSGTEAIQLSGADIELIADSAPTAGNALTIMASGDLTIASDLNAGTHALLLSEGNDAISFTGTPALTGGEITLTQETAFPQAAPATLMASIRRVFISNGASGQVVYSWMIANGISLSVLSGGDISVNDDIDLGTGSLILEAGRGATSGAINFSATEAIQLSGADIELIADSAPTVGNALTIMASGDLTIASDLNTGTHALFLSEGTDAIIFTGTPALTGGEITLAQESAFPQAAPATLTASIRRVFISNGASGQAVYSWMIVNGISLSVLSGGDISVNDDIELGTGSLVLEAGRGQTSGAINFSGTEAIQLSGADIDLIADSAPSAGNALTIMASGDLTVGSDLNAGIRALLLSEGNDAIIFTGTPTLTGGEITLAQESAFPQEAPATLTASIRRIFISNGASGQTVYSWMIVDGISLSVLSGGDISVNDDIDLGTGSLVLEAGRGDTSGGINFSGTEAIQLSGADIQLIADSAPSAGNALTIMASGDLTIASDLNAGTHALLLSEGNDAISFTGTPALTGGEITLTQEAAFPQEAPATLMASIRRIFISNAVSGQVVYSWMIVNGIGLSVLSGGDIAVNDDIDLGTGSLILEAGRGQASGGINFSGTEAIQLSGADIELIADSAPSAGNALTIMASGDLTVGSDLNAGIHALLLSEGNDAIIFTGTPVLTGGEISLTQESAFPEEAVPTILMAIIRRVFISNAVSGQVVYFWMIANGIGLSVLSGGDITVNDDIELGTGSLILEAGRGQTSGAINFSATEAIQLSGADIELIADSAPTAGNALTIMASGDLTVGSDLNAGTHALLLSEGNDAIIFTGTPALTGGEISLAQESAFPEEAVSAILTASIRRVFINNAASLQGVYSWMIANGIGLSVLSGGDITVNDDIDLGAGSLVLEAGRGDTSGAINFSGTEAIQLSGVDIDLIADRVPSVGNALTIIASGDLTIAADLNAGTHALFLSEGNDAISFTGTPILTGGEISLAQAAAFPEEAVPAILTASLRRVFISNAASGQVVYSWMIANGIGLSVLSGGDITVKDDIDLGAGSLTLEANGVIRFLKEIRISQISLSGNTITLTQKRAFGEFPPITLIRSAALVLNNTADSEQTIYDWMIESGKDLRVSSGGNIAVNDDMDLGAGNLLLDAGKAINFSRIKDIKISGRSVALLSDAEPLASDKNLIVQASSGLTMSGDLNAGQGNLALIAGTGALNFIAASSLFGRNIRLMADAAPTGSTDENAGVSVTSSRHLIISADIDAGAGDLILSAGSQLRFSRDQAVSLFGEAVLLMAASTRASGQDLTIHARRDLTIATNLDASLFRGTTGILTLEAGMGSEAENTGAIIFSDTKAVVLSGGEISLTSDIPRTSSGENLTLEATATATEENPMPGLTLNVGALAARNITLRASYLTTGDAALAVLSDENLTIETNITTGAGALRIRAGGRLRLSRSKRISLSGSVVSLTADRVRTRGHHLTVSASAGLTIATNLHAASNRDIRLEAGQGAIIFGAGVALTGRNIILRQIDAFGAAAPAALTRSRSLRLEAASAVDQEVYGWMMASNRSLFVKSGGDIVVNIDINTGRGDLTLIAGYEASGAASNTGAIIFSSSRAVELSGTRIRLNSDVIPGASNQNLTVRATRALMVGAHIASGTGNMILDAGGGALNFTAASHLSGNRITLMATAAPRVSDARVVVMTTGDLAINASINTKGDLILNVGGQLRFSRARAVSLSGAEVSLTAASTRASGENLTIRATGDLTIATDLNAGLYRGTVGNIVLIAGSGKTTRGALNFTVASHLSGRNITLTADAAPTGSTDENADIKVTSTGNLTVNTDIDSGAGDLTLFAGNQLRLAFGRSVSLSGADIFLRGRNARTRVRNRSLSVSASGDLTVRANLDTGTGDLILNAGAALIFDRTRPLTLLGNYIMLTSATAGSVSGQNLTVRAHGDLDVSTFIDVGTGNIILEAGYQTYAAGALSFMSATTLSGSQITLAGDSSPTAGNEDVMVTASSHLAINTDVNAGSGDLVFAGTGQLRLSRSKAIEFNGGNIDLSMGSSRSSDEDFTVRATGTLQMGVNVIAVYRGNSGDISLNAGMMDGTGALVFVGERRLRGSDIRLMSALNAAPAASNADLIIEAENDIKLGGSIDTGTGDISLTAGGTLTFIATTTLTGNDITLDGAGLPAKGSGVITINAGGDININSDIITSDNDGDIVLNAVGAINFSSEKDTSR